ncbi:MAG: ADP-ribosylglycohydrolase family protein [Bacteroides intestinalis]
MEWYYTQSGRRNKRFKECWIGIFRKLNQRRAPGNTCLTALSDTIAGREISHNSKGCGGVMRIAPIPLYGVAQGRISDITTLDRLAADAARLTHQHPLGFIRQPLPPISFIVRLPTPASGEGDIQELNSRKGWNPRNECSPTMPKK